jgi:hypothetical protein
LECLRYAHEHKCYWDSRLLNSAARKGQFECLSYAIENGCELGEVAEACLFAARGGHLDCLRYLHEHGDSLDHKVMEACVTSGSVECLEYVLQHPHSSSSGRLLQVACCDESVEMVKYVQKLGFPWTIGIVSCAATIGRLEVMKYAFEDGAPRSAHISAAAAGAGKLDCLHCAVRA